MDGPSAPALVFTSLPGPCAHQLCHGTFLGSIGPLLASGGAHVAGLQQSGCWAELAYKSILQEQALQTLSSTELSEFELSKFCEAIQRLPPRHGGQQLLIIQSADDASLL